MTIAGLAAAAALTAAAAPPPDPHALTARALDAMGVSRDVRALHTLRATVKVIIPHLMDGDHPGPPYLLDLGEGVMSDDLAGGRSLAEMRTTTATGSVVEVRALTAGDLIQSTVVYDGQPQAPHGVAAPANWDLANPLRALSAAEAAPDLRFEAETVVRGAPAQVVAFTHHRVAARLTLSAETALPIAVESTIALPGDLAWRPRGDLTDRTEYANWTLVSGLRYPFQWDTTRNGAPLRSTMVTRLEVDPALPTGAFELQPAARAELDLPGRRDTDTLPLGRPDRPIAEIAPGVVQIPGSWYVTLVRQPDGVVVIDAPISNGYSNQVIAEAARRFPGALIKAVVSTTSFGWHFAGLREYVARGIPVYLLDRNADLVRSVLSAPHQLDSDDLARRRTAPQLRTVAARTVIGQGANSLVLYPIRRGTAQMLMAYLPSARLLHTAEMVQPLGPNGTMLFPESLLEVSQAVADAHIEVDTVIGMHMSPTPWREVIDAIGRAS